MEKMLFSKNCQECASWDNAESRWVLRDKVLTITPRQYVEMKLHSEFKGLLKRARYSGLPIGVRRIKRIEISSRWGCRCFIVLEGNVMSDVPFDCFCIDIGPA